MNGWIADEIDNLRSAPFPRVGPLDKLRLTTALKCMQLMIEVLVSLSCPLPVSRHFIHTLQHTFQAPFSRFVEPCIFFTLGMYRHLMLFEVIQFFSNLRFVSCSESCPWFVCFSAVFLYLSLMHVLVKPKNLLSF